MGDWEGERWRESERKGGRDAETKRHRKSKNPPHPQTPPLLVL